MRRFIALDIRWTEEKEPVSVQFNGKMLYTLAPESRYAVLSFDEFAKENGIQVTEMGAVPLTEEPTENKYMLVRPIPVAGS